jgi:hypothetical protein
MPARSEQLEFFEDAPVEWAVPRDLLGHVDCARLASLTDSQALDNWFKLHTQYQCAPRKSLRVLQNHRYLEVLPADTRTPGGLLHHMLVVTARGHAALQCRARKR